MKVRALSRPSLRSFALLLALLSLGLLASCGRDLGTAPEEATGDPSRSFVQGRPAHASAPPIPGWRSLGRSSSSIRESEEWVFLLEEGVRPREVASEYGLAAAAALGEANLYLFRGSGRLDTFRQDPRVRSVQRNEALVISEPVDLLMGFYEGDWVDEDYSRQDGLRHLDLGRVHGRSDGSGVVIAILDTGADASHPHLAGRLLQTRRPFLQQSESLANGIDDDGDGLVDEAYGHGTHVAGILATVAPGATLLPLQILNDDGVGTAYELAVGLHEALWQGADIVNLSLSLSDESAVVAATLAKLESEGVLVVAAAGNSGGAPRYPATDPAALGVAALDATNVLAEFSGRGEVPLGAPGVRIVSSFPGGGLAEASGTSMACAVATGILALLRSDTSERASVDPVSRLLLTATPVLPSQSLLHGAVAPAEAFGLETPTPRSDGSPRIRLSPSQ